MTGMSRLEGRTALITGASAGIGREFARQLAALGTNLVLVSRNEEKLRDTAAEIEKRNSSIKTEIQAADLTDPGMPGEIFRSLNEKGIEIDLLINNAGFGKIGHFEEEPYETTYDMNMLNMNAVSSLCHLFIPPMLRKGEGGVINVAAVTGMNPHPFAANYAATKAYVLNLSLALWEEYRKRGVTVTALCPGHTRTDFLEAAGVSSKILAGSTVLEPDVVVSEALGGLMAGEPLVVPKTNQNVLQAAIGKLIPLKMKLKFTAGKYR